MINKTKSQLEIELREAQAQVARLEMALQGATVDKEQRFTTLFRSNPVPVGITRESDYRIVDVNDAWTRLTGYTRQEALGQTSTELGLVKPGTLRQIRGLLRNHGEVRQLEISLFTRSGEERSVLIRSEPIELDGEVYFLNNLLDMTERKQAEEKLRESEERLEKVMDGSQIGYWDWNIKTGVVHRNTRWAEMLGYTLEEIKFSVKQWTDLHHPDDREGAWKSIQDHLEGRTPAHRMEYRMRAKDGQYRWILDQARIVERDSEGKPLRMCGTHTDITERKWAEEKLRESEANLAEAQRVAKLGSWKLQIATNTVNWSDELYRVFDVEKGEFGEIYESFISRVYPDDRSLVLETNRKARESGEPFEIEYRIETRSKGLKHIREVGYALVDSSGTVIELFGIAQDITEPKQAKQELQESEERFSKAFFTSPVAQSIIAQETNEIIEVNDACCRLFGYDRAQLVGATTSKMNLWVNPAGRLSAVDELQKTGRILPRETNTRMRSGEMRTVIAAIEPISWKGSPCLISFVIDITERKQVEDQLRKSDEKYRELINGMNDTIWVIDFDTSILDVNDAASAVLGYTREQLLSMKVSEIDLSMKPAHIQHLANGMPTDKSQVFESVHTTKDGKSIPVEVSSSLVTYLGRDVIMSIARDITERKQAEQEAFHRQELLEKVVQLGKKIAAITDLEQCLYEIYQGARFGLGFDRIGLFLYDASVQLVRGIYGTTRTGEIQLPGFHDAPIDSFGGWQRAIQSPTGVAWQDDYQKHFGLSKDHEMYGVRNHIIVAAWAGEKPMALITADNLLTDRDIKPHQIEALQYFAGYAGLAIENAMLHTKLEMKVKERTAEVQDLYDNAPTGYHSLDANGCFTQINATELKWLGYTREEVLGRPFTKFVTEQSLPVFRQNFSIFKQRGWARDLEFELVRKDGSTFPVLVSASAILDTQGHYLTSRSTVFDNTERKKTEISLLMSRDELRVAYAALEVASRAKDEFLANMSHELRTPLNGILGMAEILIDQFRGPLNEHQQRLVQTIDTSGRHLLSLINDILDLSKIEAGLLEIHPEMISVDRVCQSSLSFLKAPALKKNISLEFITDPAVTMIMADERRLKQILVNLLSNAVKFTPDHGRVTLKVQLNHLQNAIDISVTDTGIGISPKDLQHIFAPFTQVDSSLTRLQEGTGLGLALVKQLVELHGGGITVTSKEEHGSCFTVSLPWQPFETVQEVLTDFPAEVGYRTQDHVSVPVKETILLAEDIETNIMTTGDYLGFLGYNMIYARNGREAVEKAESYLPDLILMDIQMPIMDGLEATRRLRRQPRFVSTPIIAMTALAMDGDRERCLEAGANEYICKPVRLKELVSLMQRMLTDNENSGEYTCPDSDQ